MGTTFTDRADEVLRPPARDDSSPVTDPAAFLRSVLNASGDCIKVLTLEGELVFMNSGGLTVMEVDDFEAIRGCPWPSFWEGPANREALAAVAHAKSGKAGRFVGLAKTMKGTSKWWEVTVTPIADEAGVPTHILSISRDITVAHELMLQRQLLADELVHRVKNVLAVVGAIAVQSFKGADPDHVQAFGARLAAMGEAQTMLAKGASLAAGLHEIVVGAMAPHCAEDRWSATGPHYELDAKRAMALALAVHELATNATKYGAFANDTGHVRVKWQVADGDLVWTWTERGGPAVEPPRRAGFGSRIINRNLAAEFGGVVDVQHPSSGILLTLTAPA